MEAAAIAAQIAAARAPEVDETVLKGVANSGDVAISTGSIVGDLASFVGGSISDLVLGTGSLEPNHRYGH